MEKCNSCGRTGEEVRLFDGFYVNNTVKICERCSLINNIPILKRPSTNQLKESEKPYAVRQRLMQMAHMKTDEIKPEFIYDKLREMNEKPEIEKPVAEELVFKLKDNFHWQIQMERRRKGLTPRQLAEALHESESAIIMLEKGIVPSNSLNLIQGIEQLLHIQLIKRDFLDRIEQEKKDNAFRLEEEFPSITEIKSSSQTAENIQQKQIQIRDLQRLSETIEKDFEYSKKTKEEVGQEQMEDIGKEDTEAIKKNLIKNSLKARGEVPTIYDLMKKKEEREKASMTGADIELE